MFEAKNPVRNADGITIDLEINHPELGLIAFTASPDDTEKYGRDIHAMAEAGNFGVIKNLKS